MGHGEVADTSLSPPLTNARLVRWMLQFLAPVRWEAAFAYLLLVLTIAAEVLVVRQVGAAVDAVKLVPASSAELNAWRWLTGSPEGFALLTAIAALLSAAGVLGALRYGREVANTWMSMEMVRHLRAATYDKLQRVGMGFHDAVSTGQLINRALTDLQNVRQFVQGSLMLLLEMALVVGGYTVLLATENGWLALLALAPLPIWVFYLRRFGRKVQPAANAVMEAQDRNVSLLTENIAGAHVVRGFATEAAEVRRYFANCDAFRRRVLRRIRLFANFQPIMRSISQASHLALFAAAGTMMILAAGRRDATGLGVGDLLVLGGAMGAILGRLGQVNALNEQYQNAVVSARRLHEVLTAPATVPERSRAIEPSASCCGEVVFDGVTFGYAPDKPVLRDVSFRAPAGAVVAVVGPTGAGKTTLTSLLGRFYDPQQGRIALDGTDLRELPLDRVRRNVAYVFQETYLFSDTVAANIAYGRPAEETDGHVEAAARLAQAHEFIEELPKGYDTVLAERGGGLSGGQKQRLAIARAILVQPRVLVLDDATAAIDPETEALIRRGMRAVLRGHTTFVIAHRVSTVRQADLVLVLGDGRLVQQGTHAELSAAPGYYRDFVESQLRPDADSHMDRMADGDEARAVRAVAAQRERANDHEHDGEEAAA